MNRMSSPAASSSQNDAARRKEKNSWLASHCRRLAIELLNLLVNHQVVFRLLGLLNKQMRCLLGASRKTLIGLS